MSDFEPVRLVDDDGTDSFEVGLLEAGRGDRPSGSARQRILAGVGIGAGVSAAALGTAKATASVASASSGATAAAAGSVGLKWGLIGTVGLLLPAAAVVIAVTSGDPKPTSAPTRQPVATTPAQPTSTAPQARPEPTLPEQAAPEPTAPAPPRPSAAKPKASLADEVAAIQKARQALSSGDTSGALRALDAYHAEFPRGRLGQEATVLRIEILVKQGDRAGARRLAQPFLKSGSPYASRIRSLLGDKPPADGKQ